MSVSQGAEAMFSAYEWRGPGELCNLSTQLGFVVAMVESSPGSFSPVLPGSLKGSHRTGYLWSFGLR